MKLRIENIQKAYKGRIVLNIDECEIKDGCITGIIGPNGAGKTTLMSIIAGLEEADCGTIFYSTKEGTELTAAPTQAVTMLFQTPYMLHTSVEKNIAYPLRLRKIEREVIDRRVGHLLEELDLVDLAKNKAWQLSGGETQKVALARAIALRPELLLLDEPTSNIDNLHVSVIEQTLLKEREKHQTTMIFISHNLAQIKRVCDQVIFMDKGLVLEQGPTSQILSNPQHERTRAFIEGELLL